MHAQRRPAWMEKFSRCPKCGGGCFEAVLPDEIACVNCGAVFYPQSEEQIKAEFGIPSPGSAEQRFKQRLRRPSVG